MKKTKLLIPIILVFLFIFCSIFTVFLFKNDTTIDATITTSKPNSSFIMADDKYCEVNVEYDGVTYTRSATRIDLGKEAKLVEVIRVGDKFYLTK